MNELQGGENINSTNFEHYRGEERAKERKKNELIH